MAGLLEMVAIVIKGNGLRILVFMPRPVNTYCFITPREAMAIGFVEISALNFNKEKRRLRLSLRFESYGLLRPFGDSQ